MTVRAQSGQQTEPTGPKFTKLVPEGDERERDVCESCGFVDYRNPKVVVGAVSTWEGRVLLCRRGIEPRVGKWGFPQVRACATAALVPPGFFFFHQLFALVVRDLTAKETLRHGCGGKPSEVC